MSHLPGPWTIEPLRSKHYGTVVRLDKNHTIAVWVGGNEPSERELEHGWTPDYGMDHVESVTDLATARLIAAAPDLLEALEGASQVLEYDYGRGIDNGYWPTVTPILKKVRAALKKARGE